jgi:leucyl-tRNA synthetase
MPYSVHLQSWPSFDPEWVQEDVVELVVQVNGKVRERLTVSPTANGADVTALALAQGKVVETLAGRKPTKVIFDPGRLVNIVVK